MPQKHVNHEKHINCVCFKALLIFMPFLHLFNIFHKCFGLFMIYDFVLFSWISICSCFTVFCNKKLHPDRKGPKQRGFRGSLEAYSLGVGLGRIGIDWIGLDWMRLDWIGLNWIGLDWIGLDWSGLDWIWLD